jgi:TonB family protein
MFDVLLESRHVRPPRPVVETAVSAVVHIAIIASLVAGTAVATNKGLQDDMQSFLQFLFPPDRANKPGDEHLAYVGVDVAGVPRGERQGDLVKVDEKAMAGEAVVPQQATQAAQLDGLMQLAEAAQAVGAFSIVDVDSAAERDPMSAAPTYPKDLLTRNIEGSATLRFVVDSTGLIDLGTVKLVAATHPQFVQAVQDAMPRMRFRPAKMGPTAVRQLAEQLFKFQIKKPSATASIPKPNS